VTLELGGNAAVIIDEGADTQLATRIAGRTPTRPGCISVQRVYVHEPYATVSAGTGAAVRRKGRRPVDRRPTSAHDRGGGRARSGWRKRWRRGWLLTGGGRTGRSSSQPCWRTCRPGKVCQAEVFAPVVASSRSPGREAVASVNDSPGLQAGVFAAWRAPSTPSTNWRSAASSSTTCPPARPDAYGGVKDSVWTRPTGAAIEKEMTELRLMMRT
jgi:acyl-CoA reductase-like NAD-dependent aldehyde dehydrogenase